MGNATDGLATIERLVEATNAHDLEGLVACFSEDYAPFGGAQ